jgi:hypothetical protein
MNQKKLSSRQANWLEEIWCYHHNIIYQRGETNLADSFSRQPDHELEEPVLAPMILAHNEMDDKTIQLINTAYTSDPYYRDPTHNRITRLWYSNGLYNFAFWICIPKDLQLRKLLLHKAHAQNLLDHHALNKTLTNLSQNWWWRGLYRDVKIYVRACQHCISKRPAQPSPTGQRQFWDSVSLDFMIKLPLSIEGNYDAVAIFVETTSKNVRIVTIPKAINGTQFATVFHDTLFRHYKIPKTLLQKVSHLQQTFGLNFFKLFVQTWTSSQHFTPNLLLKQSTWVT